MVQPSARTRCAGGLVAAFAAWGIAAAAYAQEAPSGSDVDDPRSLVQEALRANPDLVALRARTRELRAVASAAGTWDDPVVRLDYANVPIDSFQLDERPQSALVFGLSQKVPPWGWTALRERVADEQVRTSVYALEEARVQLRGEVTALFHRLTLSRQLEAVTEANLRRADELLRAVRARYETGRAAQHEVLRLEVLHERLADDLQEFRRADRELSAQLARTLARPAEATFTTPASLAPLAPDGSPDDWRRRAMRLRPELKQLEQSARAADASAELATLEARPPMTFQLAYRVRTVDIPIDDGTDQVAASITVPIPFQSALRSEAQTQAQRQVARRERARRAARIDRIGADLVAIHARWTRAYEKAKTYGDALAPRARAALDNVMAEYAVGRAGFVTLYEAEIDLLQIERGLLDATAQTHLEAAALDATIGKQPGDTAAGRAARGEVR